MNKKAIAAFCAFLLMLTICAACGKKAATSPYGKVIVDARGMEHIVMTDASGEPVMENDGSYIEVMTDSDSKKPITLPASEDASDGTEVYQTAPITAPAPEQKGRTVEDQYLSVEIPRGWESTGKGDIVLREKSTGAQIAFYPNQDRGIDEMLEEESSQRELMSTIDFEYSRDTRTIDDYEATFERLIFADVVHYNYLIWTERGMTHKIICTVPKDQEQKVNFDVVLQTVHFK